MRTVVLDDSSVYHQIYCESLPNIITELLVCLQLASLKTGLLPIGQEAVSLGEIKYYNIGGCLDSIDQDTLARTMGPNSKVRG